MFNFNIYYNWKINIKVRTKAPCIQNKKEKYSNKNIIKYQPFPFFSGNTVTVTFKLSLNAADVSCCSALAADVKMTLLGITWPSITLLSIRLLLVVVCGERYRLFTPDSWSKRKIIFMEFNNSAGSEIGLTTKIIYFHEHEHWTPTLEKQLTRQQSSLIF